MNLSREIHRWRLRRATAHQVTPALSAFIDQHVDPERPVFQIRPYPGDGGIHGAISLLDDMHRVRRSRIGRNHSETNSYEIWHEPGPEGVLSFNVAPGPRDAASVFEQLMEDLPNSEIRQRTRQFPQIPEGWYVATARSSFFRGSVYPIRHVNIDGFSNDGSGGVRDPYKSILTKVAQDEDVGVAVQAVFRPTTGSWLENSRRERASARLRSTKTVTDWLLLKRYERDPTAVEQTAAKIIEQQQYAEQFGVELRLLAWAERPGAAEKRLQAVARALGQYYESHTRQGIAVHPAGVRTLGVMGGGRDLRNVLRDTAERRISTPLLGTPGEKTVDAEELAGLIHVPGEGVNHGAIDRSESKSGRPVPNRTPRFNFDAVEGVDRHSTPHDRQRALMLESDPGDPFWLGFGARKGSEAGIFSDVLNTHAVAPGRTGVGKTTTAKNLFYQVVNRGYGALFFDPKGKDASGFASLIPEEREEDLIYLRIGADDDHVVGFNFMEPPGSAEPGTDDYAGALESVGDDLEAILPMASGDPDESWGPRMSRITRNFARGFGRIGADATILDLHYALASETGRRTYADTLSEENIRFIEDYAVNHLADMDDDVIEPLAGRVQQFVENPIVRRLVSIRDGFSIDDAIADGKIIIVEDATSSDTTGKMVAAALIRRIWVAVREQSHDADRPDPPRFFIFPDEFNEIASAASGVTEVFQDARAYGLSLVAMLQDMTADLDKDVRAALEGQTETKITYNPGRKTFAKLLEAHHSDDIDAQDLQNLSPYTFYLRTRNQQDITTKSYKVNAFPPIDEVAPEVARDEEDTEALIDRRIRDVGQRRKSAEEQQDEALFRDGPGDDPELERKEIQVTPTVERAVAAAVYTAACRWGSGDEDRVDLDDAAPVIRRYLGRLDETPDEETLAERIGSRGDLSRRVLQHIPADVVEQRVRDGVATLRVPDPRSTIADVGEDQTAAGIEHLLLMWRAWRPLAEAGIDLWISQASGADPDAIGWPAPEAEQADPELVERLTGGREVRIEAEHTTGESAPAATARHVCQAANEDRGCVALAHPDIAEKVVDTLLEEPRYAKTGHSENGEIRYYNRKTRLRVDGEVMTRPGEEENVWIREDTGDVVLRDNAGEEWARFADPADVFRDRGAYPSGGQRNIRAPLIPEHVLEESAAPRAVVLPVPEGSPTVADLQPIGPELNQQKEEDQAEMLVNGGGAGQDLDVPDRAVTLLRILQEHGEPVTAREAEELADLDVSYRTIKNYLDALEEEGAVQSGDYRPDEGVEYRPALKPDP